MHVCTRVCAGISITAILTAFVLGFGHMWFTLVHDGADIEWGWAGLYGTLTLAVGIAGVAGCAKHFGWGAKRVVLPVHIQDDDDDE